MRFDIVTIFPRMIEAALTEGILARAIQRNVLTVRARDFASSPRTGIARSTTFRMAAGRAWS